MHVTVVFSVDIYTYRKERKFILLKVTVECYVSTNVVCYYAVLHIFLHHLVRTIFYNVMLKTLITAVVSTDCHSCCHSNDARNSF